MKLTKRTVITAIGAGILLLVLLLAAVLTGYFSNEPVYQGRTFSSWFSDMNWTAYTGRPQQQRFDAAVKAIRAFGTNACEPLLQMIGHEEDERWANRYWKFYYGVNPRWRRFLPEAQYPGWHRLMALQVLPQLDLPARTAMTPQLIDILEDYYSRECGRPRGTKVDWTSEFFNPPVKDYLTQGAALEVRNGKIQIDEVVKMSASDDPRLFPMLLVFAQETALTKGAKGNFSYYSPPTNLAAAARVSLPILLAGATNQDHYVRFTALAALGLMADESAEAREAIIAALSDPDMTVRRLVTAGATKFALEPARIAEIVNRVKDFGPSGFVATATNGLAKTFTQCPPLPANWGRDVTAHFGELMENTNPAVRAGAIRSLRFYTPGLYRAGKLVAARTNETVEPDENVRKEAAEVFALRPTNLPPKLEMIFPKQ